MDSMGMHEKRHVPQSSPDVAASDSDGEHAVPVGGGRHDQV